MINTDQLYARIIEMVSVKREDNDDFRSVVKHTLRKYRSYVQDLDKAERTDDWESITMRIDQFLRPLIELLNQNTEELDILHTGY